MLVPIVAAAKLGRTAWSAHLPDLASLICEQNCLVCDKYNLKASFSPRIMHGTLTKGRLSTVDLLVLNSLPSVRFCVIMQSFILLNVVMVSVVAPKKTFFLMAYSCLFMLLIIFHLDQGPIL